jgi:ABC-type branched-subunit amino acid transport system substrate-binding protein
VSRPIGFRALLGLALVGGLGLAACGSDNSGSTSATTAASAATSAAGAATTSAATTAAGAATTGAATTAGGAATSAAKPVSGDPVKVVAVTTPITEKNAVNGAKLGEAVVNANGGIKGRPLQIIQCSDGQDPNKAAACIRDAISQGAVAEVQRTSSYGASMNPLLQAANMCTIGGGIYSQADFTAANMFPHNSGIFSTIGSAPAAVKQLNAKKIGVPYVDVPAGAALAPTIKPIIEAMGASIAAAVPVPPTAADVTSQVATMVAANPDVVVDGLTLDAYVKFIKGMRQQGSNANVLISDGVMDTPLFVQNLKGTDNIYQVAEDDKSSDGYKQFQSDFQKYAADKSDQTGNVVWGWFAAQLFQNIANNAASLDAKGICDQANKTSNFTIGNIVPPLDFTKPSSALGGKAPRLFNDGIYLFKFNPTDGTISPVGNGQAVHALTGG